MYASPLPLLEGKMTQATHPRHERIPQIQIPSIIAKEYTDVALSMDIFYMDAVKFLCIKSEKIDFCTVKFIKGNDNKENQGAQVQVQAKAKMKQKVGRKRTKGRNRITEWNNNYFI